MVSDGIFMDKDTGLWYVVSYGVRYDGFLTYEEAEKWSHE